VLLPRERVGPRAARHGAEYLEQRSVVATRRVDDGAEQRVDHARKVAARPLDLVAPPRGRLGRVGPGARVDQRQRAHAVRGLPHHLQGRVPAQREADQHEFRGVHLAQHLPGELGDGVGLREIADVRLCDVRQAADRVLP
jgi:hypothetical protein